MDTIRGNPPDVKWQNGGAGMSMTFRCAACALPKPILGRRLRRVHGVRQFVCSGCVDPAGGVRGAA